MKKLLLHKCFYHTKLPSMNTYTIVYVFHHSQSFEGKDKHGETHEPQSHDLKKNIIRCIGSNPTTQDAIHKWSFGQKNSKKKTKNINTMPSWQLTKHHPYHPLGGLVDPRSMAIFCHTQKGNIGWRVKYPPSLWRVEIHPLKSIRAHPIQFSTKAGAPHNLLDFPLHQQWLQSP